MNDEPLLDILDSPGDSATDSSSLDDVVYDFEYLEGLVLENQYALEVLATEADATSTLLAQSNELLLHIYAAQLYFIGVCGALLVIALLYKFLRKFF